MVVLKVLFGLVCLWVAAAIIWIGPHYLDRVSGGSVTTWIIGGNVVAGVLTIVGMSIIIETWRARP